MTNARRLGSLPPAHTLGLACAGLFIAAGALASPPAPLDSPLFAFPGSAVAPASARSAGLALADRWLGDDPFDNPAVGRGRAVVVSPTLFRMSRQDLRADNRQYDETAAFIDAAGVAFVLPAPGPFTGALYAYQPVLRLEDNGFTRGRAALDPGTTAAVIESHSSASELRAGLALGAAQGAWRAGVGVEWLRREDRYERIEQSGDPANAGKDSIAFKGDGLALQGGVRWDRGDSTRGSVSIGAAARYLPELSLEGPFTRVRLNGTTRGTIVARRARGWEMGLTARCVLGPAFRLLAAVGGRGAQRWEGLDLAAGRAWEWKLAGEFHDARDPWTLRLGLGQERQHDVPDPRAFLATLGFGWRFDGFAADAALMRRTITRPAEPRLFEDRLVVSVRVPR